MVVVDFGNRRGGGGNCGSDGSTCAVTAGSGIVDVLIAVESVAKLLLKLRLRW